MLTSRGTVQRQQQHAGPRQGWFLGLKNKTFVFKNIFLFQRKTNKRDNNILTQCLFSCGIINLAPKAPGGKNRVFGRTKKIMRKKSTRQGALIKTRAVPGFPGRAGPWTVRAGPAKTGFGPTQPLTTVESSCAGLTRQRKTVCVLDGL